MTQSVEQVQAPSGMISIKVNQFKHKKIVIGCAIAAIVCFVAMLGFLTLDPSLSFKVHVFHHLLNPSALEISFISSAFLGLGAWLFAKVGGKKQVDVEIKKLENDDAKILSVIRYLKSSFLQSGGFRG